MCHIKNKITPIIKTPLPFQNRMPNLHKLLTHSPNQTKLFKIYADPPTTTMQRIKGSFFNTEILSFY